MPNRWQETLGFQIGQKTRENFSQLAPYLLGLMISLHALFPQDPQIGVFYAVGHGHMKCIVIDGRRSKIEQNDLLFNFHNRSDPEDSNPNVGYVPIEKLLPKLMESNQNSAMNISSVESVYTCVEITENFNKAACPLSSKENHNEKGYNQAQFSNADQITNHLAAFLDALSNQHVRKDSQVELNQFMNSLIQVMKQLSVKSLSSFMALTVGMFGHRERNMRQVFSVNVTSLKSSQTDTVILTSTKSDSARPIAIYFESTADAPHISSFHCLPLENLKLQKINFALMALVRDDYYKIQEIRVCHFSLSHAIEEYLKKIRSSESLANTFTLALTKTVASTDVSHDNVHYFFMGNILGVPKLAGKYAFDDSTNCLTYVQRELFYTAYNYFIARIGEGCTDEIYLPREYKRWRSVQIREISLARATSSSIRLRNVTITPKEYIDFFTVPLGLNLDLIFSQGHLALLQLIHEATQRYAMKHMSDLIAFLTGYASLFHLRRSTHITGTSFYLTDGRSFLIINLRQFDEPCPTFSEIVTQLKLSQTEQQTSIDVACVEISVQFTHILQVISFKTTSFNYMLMSVMKNSQGAAATNEQSASICGGTKVTDVDLSRLKIHGAKENNKLKSIELIEQNSLNMQVDHRFFWFLVISSAQGFSLVEKSNGLSNLITIDCPNAMFSRHFPQFSVPIDLFLIFNTLQKLLKSSARAKIFHAKLSSKCGQPLQTVFQKTYQITEINEQQYNRYGVTYQQNRPTSIYSMGSVPFLTNYNDTRPVDNFLGKTSKIGTSSGVSNFIYDDNPADIKIVQNVVPPEIRMNCSANEALHIHCAGQSTSNIVIHPTVVPNCTYNVAMTITGVYLIDNRAMIGKFTYNISGASGSMLLNLPSSPYVKPGNSHIQPHHQIILNQLIFSNLSIDSGFHIESGSFRICYHQESVNKRNCPVKISLDEEYQRWFGTVTVFFGDSIKCVLDVFEGICTGRTLKNRQQIDKEMLSMAAQRFRATIILRNEEDKENFVYCPLKASVTMNPFTVWRYVTNNPMYKYHIFCASENQSSYFDVKLARPNYPNTLAGNANSIHIHKLPAGKVPIFVSLYRLCWQLKARDRELKLHAILKGADLILTVVNQNKTVSETSSRFLIGKIVLYDVLKHLDRVHLELESMLHFQVQAPSNFLRVLPQPTIVTENVQLLVLQAESSVRPMHFLIHLIMGHDGASKMAAFKSEDSRHLLLHFAVCDTKNQLYCAKDGFTVLMVRFFESKITGAFGNVRLTFLDHEFAIRRTS